MPFLYSTTEQNAAMSAAASADNGSKRAAYLASWQSSIGSDAKVVLYRDATPVWVANLTGAVPVVGPSIIINSVTQASVSEADINTGSWELRVEKSSDAAVYFGATVAADAAPEIFHLSDDLESDSTVSVSITFNAPALDTVGGGGSGGTGLTAALLEGDVNTSLAHEMLLDGINPAWSWGTYPRSGTGANPPSASGWTAPCFIPWGVAGTERNNAPGTHNWRIATLEIHTHERRGGQWQTVHSAVISHTQIGGAMYLDYETNAQTTADVRSTNGYDEVKFPNAGGSYHFYPSFRTDVPTSGCQQRVVLIRASLTLDNPGGTDDRASARVALLVGGDYWRSQSTQWGDGYSNDDFWIGRARKPALWPNKSWHAAHTMTSEADINEYIAWLATQGIG